MRHLRTWCCLCLVMSAVAESDRAALAEAPDDESSPGTQTTERGRSPPIVGVQEKISQRNKNSQDWVHLPPLLDGGGDWEEEEINPLPPSPADETQRGGTGWTALWIVGAIGWIVAGGVVYVIESMDPTVAAAVCLAFVGYLCAICLLGFRCWKRLSLGPRGQIADPLAAGVLITAASGLVYVDSRGPSCTACGEAEMVLKECRVTHKFFWECTRSRTGRSHCPGTADPVISTILRFR